MQGGEIIGLRHDWNYQALSWTYGSAVNEVIKANLLKVRASLLSVSMVFG